MVDTHPSPDWDRGVYPHALAYLITGHADYAQVAIQLMFGANRDGAVYMGTNAISGDSGYQVRTLLPQGAALLDWTYPVLTPQQRLDLVACLEQWAEWVFPDTNPSRAGAWGVDDAGSNYFTGFLVGVWTVALALYGDSSKAQSLIDLSRRKFDGMMLPYWNGMGKGGQWPEDGSSYGASSTTFMFQALEANFTATGEDLLTSLAWPRDAVTTTIATTTPDCNRRWPWGDQARSSAGYLDDIDRMAMLFASRWDNRAAPWTDSITPNRATGRANMWADFLVYHSPVPVEEER